MDERESDRIERLIVEAVRQKLPPESSVVVEPDVPFADLGIDSVELSEVAGDLEDLLGIVLPETLLFEAPTIRRLARLLAGDAPEHDAAERRPADEPIAIVGLSCRFPGSDGASAFWRIVRDRLDAVVLEPAERAALRGDPEPLRRWGGYLDDIDRFAADFFGITPREAAVIDPQQRLLLEVAWNALEDAGLPAERLAGRDVGVYVGVSGNDYASLVQRTDEGVDIHAATGNSSSVVANRLSYLLDLRGPSVAVDTACSSSLVALHLACQSLLTGDSEIAVAGGVNVVLLPLVQDGFQKAGVMALDGRCKTFRADADGYVRGEGCGVVVLKRLSDVEPTDRVLALIHGTAVNQDGFTNGLTAPNGASQRAVIRRALSRSSVDPARVGYVEAHGTGTILGDPIEVAALAEEYAAKRRDVLCRIGSVKANIGHLESAAGIAGVIKVVLALRDGTIPPQPDPAPLNPRLDFGDGALEVPFKPVPWPSSTPYAAVSSFGFGGTNAHAILGPAPTVERPAPAVERPLHVAALSAKSADDLVAAAVAASRVDGPVGDVCFTLSTSRSAFAHRLAVLAPDLPTLRVRLRSWAVGATTGGIRNGHRQGRPLRPVFVFAGQSGQRAGMGRELYESHPLFRELISRCDPVVQEAAGRSVSDVICAASDDPIAAEVISSSRLAQPVLVAFEWALASLWQAWGVQPSAVIGHSLGEFAAAVVAGIHDLDDVLRFVALRGGLLDDLDVEGGLLAVFDDADAVRAAVSRWPHAEVVGRNSPRQTLVAGPTATVDEVEVELGARGFTVRRINNPPAHSSLLEPAGRALGTATGALVTSPTRIPFVSGVPASRLEVGETLHVVHWPNHLCRPLDFPRACSLVDASEGTAFVTIGPGGHLATLVRDSVGPGPLYLSSLTGADDVETISSSLAAYWVAGGSVDWRAFDRGYDRRRVDATGYPYQRQRHWVGTTPTTREAPSPAPAGAVERPHAPAGAPAATSVLGEVRELAAEVTGIEASLVPVDAALLALGLDSVLVVELRNRLEERFADVPPLSMFMDGMTIGEIAASLTVVVAPGPAEPVPSLAPPAADDEFARLVAAMTWVDGEDNG